MQEEKETSSELSQEEKDSKTLKYLQSLENHATEYVKPFMDEWEENERFYNGDHFKNVKDRNPKNWVFNIVESELPILLGNAFPSCDIIPLHDDRMEDAKMLDAGVQAVYQSQNLHIKKSMALRTTLKNGTGWIYVDYDPDLQRGQGDVTLDNVSYRNIKIDPACNDIDNAKYVIIEFPTDFEEIKRKYPHKAALIEKQSLDQKTSLRKLDGYDSSRWVPPQTNGQETSSRFDAERMSLIKEYWIRDYEMEKTPPEETLLEIAREADELMQAVHPDIGQYEDHDSHIEAHTELKQIIQNQLAEIEGQLAVIDPNTEEGYALVLKLETGSIALAIIDDHIKAHNEYKEINPKGERQKYPGNLRLVITTGSIILYDGPSPIDDGMVPLVPFYCYKTEDSVYGIGAIKNIKGPQKTYNDCDFAEIQGLRLTSNPGWVVDEESGVDQDTLTNEPGIVVKKKQGTEVTRLAPGQVSPQLERRKVMDREAVESIEGVNEVSQGRKISSGASGIAIERLQAQVVGRVQLKSQYCETYSMPRLTKLVASRIITYYKTERMLRIYDNNGQIKFVKFDPSKVQDLIYEVRAVPGGTGLTNKNEVLGLMKELLIANIIDVRTFFETTDLPFKGTILKKIDEKEKAMMQQAQMEQALLQQAELEKQAKAQGQQMPTAQPITQ